MVPRRHAALLLAVAASRATAWRVAAWRAARQAARVQERQAAWVQERQAARVQERQAARRVARRAAHWATHHKAGRLLARSCSTCVVCCMRAWSALERSGGAGSRRWDATGTVAARMTVIRMIVIRGRRPRCRAPSRSMPPRVLPSTPLRRPPHASLPAVAAGPHCSCAPLHTHPHQPLTHQARHDLPRIPSCRPLWHRPPWGGGLPPGLPLPSWPKGTATRTRTLALALAPTLVLALALVPTLHPPPELPLATRPKPPARYVVRPPPCRPRHSPRSGLATAAAGQWPQLRGGGLHRRFGRGCAGCGPPRREVCWAWPRPPSLYRPSGRGCSARST